MTHSIEFYTEDRVDVGIGASKDVRVVYQGGFVEHAKSKAYLRLHPNSGAVRFELLNSTTLRVINNSSNVVSLWPGELFLTVVAGHPVYEALSDVAGARLGVPVKETVVTGSILSVRTETDLKVLELGYSTNIKLQDAGYHTVEQLDKTHSEDLLSIKGIGESTVEKVRRAIEDFHSEQELQDWRTEYANDRI